jgi:hypothetical protein
MEIKLEENILLTSDENQFVLKKENGLDKKNETTYKTLGYYSTLPQALKGYVKHKTRVSQATTLQQVINEIEALENHINIKFGGE